MGNKPFRALFRRRRPLLKEPPLAVIVRRVVMGGSKMTVRPSAPPLQGEARGVSTGLLKSARVMSG
jgi:hypothetical protein